VVSIVDAEDGSASLDWQPSTTRITAVAATIRPRERTVIILLLQREGCSSLEFRMIDKLQEPGPGLAFYPTALA
jgi:hypothetical protein